jgi:hypothetical protein
MRAGPYVFHIAVSALILPALGCAPDEGAERSAGSAVVFAGHARSPLEDGVYDGRNATVILSRQVGQTQLEPDHQVIQVDSGTEGFCTGNIDVGLLGAATAVHSFEPPTSCCESGRITQEGARLTFEGGLLSVTTLGSERFSLGETAFVRRRNGALSGTYKGGPYTIRIDADTENAFRYRVTVEGSAPRDGTAKRKIFDFLDRNTFESAPSAEHGIDEITPGRRDGKFFLSYQGRPLERIGD